ncbi:dienelactone hydrolase family protein [Herbiconiux sp. CPCC 205716]|uniref:Dienelactone hydrolase family protein n=1 Tax=Herbiconiux gentiana TaxID=2970912 RepID=A0ABT2GLG1_9MICO|nr:dienelactone hydrolase family protein [Herbiconiux gentiana]MCS5715774.1 dienelactone hydrolase family protein [Herbiconiux gentiana]
MASTAASAPTATLDGWARSPVTAAGVTHDCYEKGSGPGVVLIPELPGLTPQVLGLAQHLVDEGFTVVVPSPFGVPERASSPGYVLSTVARICVSAEFRAFAIDAKRPVTAYLRAVAADLASRTPGKGVGVIGMCFTGGFALATAVDDSVLASVVSQPAAPFPVGRARQADPSMSRAELDRVVERSRETPFCALGLRFSEDRNAPRARFDTLSAALGDRFEVIELDSAPGNAGGFSASAHSVLTGEVREVPGHPTLVARERVVAFLREQLT